MPTRAINLTKLRPGDFIFTLNNHWKSFGIAAGTFGCFSHAIVVVYPDVWFETDSRGSGYRVIQNTHAFHENGVRAFVAPVTNLQFKVRRLNGVTPNPHDILDALRDSIALDYPHPIEMLPVLLGFRSFPTFTSRLVNGVRRRIGRMQTPYCSQLVLQTMQKLVPQVATLTHQHHITPAQLYRQLRPHTSDVTPETLHSRPVPSDDPKLLKLFSNLTAVTQALADFQYPHNEAQWRDAMERLLRNNNMSFDRNKIYAADLSAIQSIVADPKKFRLHDWFWPSHYQ
jgi:hypothetical protein